MYKNIQVFAETTCVARRHMRVKLFYLKIQLLSESRILYLSLIMLKDVYVYDSIDFDAIWGGSRKKVSLRSPAVTQRTRKLESTGRWDTTGGICGEAGASENPTT